jgi:hypothetical protein
MGLMNGLGGLVTLDFSRTTGGLVGGVGRVMACALNRFLYFLYSPFSAFAPLFVGFR